MRSWPAWKRWKNLGVVLLILLGGTASCTREEVGTMEQPESGGDLLVFFGTYTRTDSEGIYTYRMDSESGALERLSVVSGIENPSFLALHPSGRYLYAVSEIAEFEGQNTGTVSAYSIDSASGQLSFLNLQPSAGAVPCHLVVDQAGRNLLLATYTGGTVASFPIDSEGRLGPATSVIQHEGSSVDPVRQTGPRAHSINLDRGTGSPWRPTWARTRSWSTASTPPRVYWSPIRRRRPRSPPGRDRAISPSTPADGSAM